MRALLLAIILAIVPVAGCSLLHAAVPVLTDIARIIIDAQSTLEVIDAGVQDWLVITKQSDEVRSRYEKIRARCHSALNVAAKGVAGATELDQGKYDAAFRDFRAAWVELEKFLKDTGALSGKRLGLGGKDYPEPAALTYKPGG